MDSRSLAQPRSVSRASRPATSSSVVVTGFEATPAGERASRLVRLVLAVIGAVALLTGFIPGLVRPAAAATPSAYLGFDVSWPNCGRTLPSGTVLAVVGVTGGKPFTTNPCFRAEYLAARQRGVVRFYINLNKPRGDISLRGPAGHCSTTNWICRGYNYGWHAASAAWRHAASQIGTAPLHTRWWLDVETSNTWSTSTRVNARVVAGALAFLRSAGHADRVGAYSTNYQWHRIVGSYRPGVASWYATTASSASSAAAFCSSRYAFAGGAVRMVQYAPVGIDRDYLCH